jgi:putative hydrolase of the HAD superfamily
MEGLMARVEAVLLDLYDTLVWADWVALRSGRDRLAERAGVEIAVAREQWAQTHDRRMRGLNRGLEGDLAAVFEACGVATTPDLLRDLAAEEYANWAGGVRAYEDVAPELGRLRAAGYRLAIVSNASCEAGGVVASLGLDRLVDTVVLSCDVGFLKPEPAILQAALERLGTSPEQALLVDDLPTNLDAAASLGLRTALMARPGGRTVPPSDAPHRSTRGAEKTSTNTRSGPGAAIDAYKPPRGVQGGAAPPGAAAAAEDGAHTRIAGLADLWALLG